MKTRKILIISVLVILSNFGYSKDDLKKENQPAQAEHINIICSDEIKLLAGEWANDFSSQNPSAIVNIKNAPVSEIILNPGTDIAIVNEAEGEKMLGWKMTVAREVIIPVINSTNPFLMALENSGVSIETMKDLFQEQNEMNWGMLLGNGETNQLKIFILNDQSIISSLKTLFNISAVPDKMILVDSREKIMESLKSDPYALAFCDFPGIIDPLTNQFKENIAIVPVDKNANGKIDYMENIYQDADAFARGVWIGKYPEALTNDIYAVSAGEPVNTSQRSFISWLLTVGQKSLAAYGYTDLASAEVQSKLDRIQNADVTIPPVEHGVSVPKLAMFIIAAILLLGILFGAFIGYGKKEDLPAEPEYAATGATFSEKSVNAPAGLFYDKSHTWAFMEKDGTVKTGIDDFIQHITGPITRIEMKKPGDRVKKGELFLSLIQKGKQLSLYAPVSGTIIECNRMLHNNSAALNSSPYGEGWVYRIEPSSWLQEILMLSMAEKYTKWISGEFARLKDFLAVSLQSHKVEYAGVVLQDGGALKNNVLEELGPEVWEDFQSKFIDTCI